jgi:CRP/FNR family cyclic AMP-dependent transcriptional regulator
MSTADTLDDALLREIAGKGGIKRYPAQSILINEGDSSDSIYILLSGRVKVYSTNPEGKEVVIATHGAGEYIGELSLDGGVRSASVMTLEPTMCSVVSGSSLREFIRCPPGFRSRT